MPTDYHKIAKYLMEISMMGRRKHAGLYLGGTDLPENLATHSFRAAHIGYILAKLEKADPQKTALICLIHDNAEARIGDRNFVAMQYLDIPGIEEKAYKDQVRNLPAPIAGEFLSLFREFEKSKEGIIARDADRLDRALKVKELIDNGNKQYQIWIDNTKKLLLTKSAKKVLQAIEHTLITDWWKDMGDKTCKELSEL